MLAKGLFLRPEPMLPAQDCGRSMFVKVQALLSRVAGWVVAKVLVPD